MGFFAEAGPLQVFVSNHLIPEGFEFNTAHEPCYQTADGEQKIVPGSEVRLRIVGTRVDASDIVSAVPSLAALTMPAWSMTLVAPPAQGQPGRRQLRCAWSWNPSAPWLPCLQFAVGSIKEDYLGVVSAPL